MMQYQNQQMCNTENCKRCYKKQGCPKYLAYLENIVATPISMISPNLSSIQPSLIQSKDDEMLFTQSNIDLSSINKSIAVFQKSTTELIYNYSIDLGNKFKSLNETNNGLTNELSVMKNTIIELNEKFSKLDSLIDMIEIHNVQSDNVESAENSLTVYTGTSESEKTLVAKTSKGFLGFGKKTEWVEE